MLKTVQLKDLSPASYNPRRLSPTAFEDLKASITTLGIIKPIVIRGSDGLILAGHQRTKTMLALGITEAPAFIVEDVNSSDEVRFNQMHNFTEAEVTERAPVIKCNIPEGATGFVEIANKDICIIKGGEEGQKILFLTKMILKYGQFASCVCDSQGNVLVSSIYAKAAKLNGLSLLVYVLPEGLEKDCLRYFAKDYGEFCYDNIERKTYMQSFAQKARLRKSGKDKTQLAKGCHSTLYEKCVLPYITKEMRCLDFGAGQKDYATMLRKHGYNIDAIEFFHRKDNVDQIDVTEIRNDCKEICEHLAQFGQYDVVICDSVLNSVDSLQAEAAVLTTISALCKPEGIIFWSGIPFAFAKQNSEFSKCVNNTMRLRFFDENHFSANFRHGEWFFQKYHTLEDIKRLTVENIGELLEVYDDGAPLGKRTEVKTTSFQVKTKNTHPRSKSEIMEAVKFEFSLPLPGGRRWDLDEQVLPILDKLIPDGVEP